MIKYLFQIEFVFVIQGKTPRSHNKKGIIVYKLICMCFTTSTRMEVMRGFKYLHSI